MRESRDIVAPPVARGPKAFWCCRRSAVLLPSRRSVRHVVRKVRERKRARFRDRDKHTQHTYTHILSEQTEKTEEMPMPMLARVKCERKRTTTTCGLLTVVTIFLLVVFCNRSAVAKPPHIVFILADDLGWYDVGFHGSGLIKTPNIDALAYTGLMLQNYYVTPICTPSRSALMTGKYPIHTGMQHGVLKGAEPRGLPLSEKLLPEYLQELGYTNYIVGKWHLGFHKKEYTPTFRGFKKHVGLWSGHHDYFDHTAVESPYWGLDMRRDLEPAWDLHGRYSTEVFTETAVDLIEGHNTSNPLFLYLAHTAVHSGNPYNPLPARDEALIRFDWIKDYQRRRFAAMLYELDISVGKVVEALRKREMLADSVIVFTTDNGGPAAGFNANSASNWPLRGVKNTLWEGGVRGAALLWSPLLPNPGRVAHQLFHITDWLPTILTVAGASEMDVNGTVSSKKLDGTSLWKALIENSPSPRTSVLHNIDDIYKVAGITVNGWKLVDGTTYDGHWDDRYATNESKWTYEEQQVIDSLAGKAVAALGFPITHEGISSLRKKAAVSCDYPIVDSAPCKPLQAACLFNVREDPCEINNMAQRHPEIVASLRAELKKFNDTAIPPGNLPWDPKANPELWDHTWNNFGDYESQPSVNTTS